jgi:NADH:ubiquinone oxidoreductase subunit F (NADH-binding)
LNMDQVLKITKNYPTWPFFVQVGGDAAGIVLNRHQLDAPASGAASITIHHLDKHDHLKMFKYWLKFFKDSACGQCVPGREGTYRLEEMFKNKIPDIYAFQDILDDLETSAFCALCAEAPIPIKSYLKNIMHLRK